MAQFKFTEDERKKLKALAPNEEWFDRYPYFNNLIDRIESLISERDVPAPTESARAEEVLMKLHTHHEEELGITWRSAIQAMITYADPFKAEAERLRKEVDRLSSVSPKIVLPPISQKIGMQTDYAYSNGFNHCLSELRRLNPHMVESK